MIETCDDERACAMAVAEIRNTHNGGQSNLPVETADEGERLQGHYLAAVAEITVAKDHNLWWSGCAKGSLGAPDVGNLIEVRSVVDPTHGLLVRDKDRPKWNHPIVLVLVAPGGEGATPLGWTWVSEVFERGRHHQGVAPFWTLPATRLRHMDELQAYVLEWLWSKH